MSARRAARPQPEDPLAELARILGEGVAHPVRPEHVVEIGRRTLPQKPAPQQVSDLEAELFESLRSSVAPEDRVRGDFAREVPPIIPQRPVDDHDIASLRAITSERVEEAPARQPATATEPDPRLADYYAYDDGVSAGSYDPAFASAHPADLDGAFAAEIQRSRGGAGPRPTFDEFDTDAIAEAAWEASPYVADDAAIAPHSPREEYEARRLQREAGRGGLRTAVTLVGILLAGGGALAAWKYLGPRTSHGPVEIHADGQPLKVLPDPTKATPVAEGEVSLKRDTKVDGSKIVSLQEDPVEHVAGRTADGREVRVINPGAQRPAGADQPRTVKTVVVRPDGSIVSDGDGAPVAAKPVATTTITPAGAPSATGAAPVPSVPTATPPADVPAVPPTTAPATGEAIPMPVAAPPRPAFAAAPQAPGPTKPVATTPVRPVAEPAPAAPAKAVPVAPKAPAATAGAPMALGPVAARPAAAPAATPPRPATPPAAPAAPVAQAPTVLAPASTGGGSGDWVVQLSASKSEAEARGAFAAAQRRYTALAGKSADVQRADLGAKGTFYRTRVAAGSRDAANALCAQIKSQGGDCMVSHR